MVIYKIRDVDRIGMRLGVNIDHIATLREARKGDSPDPAFAALIAENCGADSIVVHLREDRRHINDTDVFILRSILKTKLNLEMSISPKIVKIACRIKPDRATLVPEKRKELTTEGGLDVSRNFLKVKRTVSKLELSEIKVSLFIDPIISQVKSAKDAGAGMIELHTGAYAEAKNKSDQKKELVKLRRAASLAKALDLKVFAGHGLDYNNVIKVAEINEIEELNIGHSIVSRAIFCGLGKAVKDMKELIR